MIHNIPFIGEAFNGIISYFYSYGDPISNNAIIVSPSSEYGVPTFGLANSVLNGSHERGWYSNNVQLSYINFSFPGTPIRLTYYTLQSPYHMDNTNYATSWALMGKNINDASWTIINNQVGQTVLIGNGIYSTFSCVSPMSFTLFQIQMIGQNSDSRYHFGLKRVEFFGSVSSLIPSFDHCYCTEYLFFYPLKSFFTTLFPFLLIF